MGGAHAFSPAFAIQQAGLAMPGLGVSGACPVLPAAAAAAAAANRLGLSGLGPAHCVLLVSNLNPESVTPICLFTLFGVYGDVMRVKILFNKKDNALVQMADGTQAQLAMSHLNGQKLHGKAVLCDPVQAHHRAAPPRGARGPGPHQGLQQLPPAPLQKARLQKLPEHIPPLLLRCTSPTSRPSVVEEDLKVLFASSGALVKAFKFFQKDRKMALIQMGSVEEAIESLIEFHNHDLGENHHLRVSFSKSTI
ncbi:hypothetical protein SKAU_G00319420 [Synaphobranchus kaupii]|uniref:RRM domain-containing protein n=1 Tax=Synaphobranchus kaupii TaxID=118154 RepID=A0A9Q1IJQ6_SYNKA|nr:hypothetical protein SKAU_G00319420 [Synaphobranchus kaupii]